MKRTALVERASRSGTYVMCVDSGGNPESLEVRKIYRALPDARAAEVGYLRVVDESGESYLYPEKFFIGVTLPRPLPRTARKAFVVRD